jgi:hypothetical protein
MSTIHGRIDPLTGVYAPYPRPEPDRPTRPINPETAKEEAQRLGAALAQGLRVVEARADNPTEDMEGCVKFVGGSTREYARVTIAGALNRSGWPPDWPSRSARPRTNGTLRTTSRSYGWTRPATRSCVQRRGG